MGWTYTRREKGCSHKDWFQKHVYGDAATVLDVAAKRGVAYAAVLIAQGDRDPLVIADAISFRWAPASADFNFGYKVAPESMGPVSRDCPERILDLLSPLDRIWEPDTNEYEWAKEWRQACRAKIEHRKRRPKVCKGDVIEFPQALDYGRWGKHRRFEITNLRRNFARPLGRGPGNYRLPADWRDRGFAVIERAADRRQPL